VTKLIAKMMKVLNLFKEEWQPSLKVQKNLTINITIQI